MAILMGADGRPVPCHEPIPGVYLPESVCRTPEQVRAKLCDLFPLPFFAALRGQHPTAFEGQAGD